MAEKESRKLSRHALAAGLLAAAAGLGALFTVLHVSAVLLALVAAGLAELGALFHDVRSVLRATGHEAGGKGADVGAVAVEAYAADHHFNVLLLQAGGGAVLAGGDAGIEGVEEGLILSMHEESAWK